MSPASTSPPLHSTAASSLTPWRTTTRSGAVGRVLREPPGIRGRRGGRRNRAWATEYRAGFAAPPCVFDSAALAPARKQRASACPDHVGPRRSGPATAGSAARQSASAPCGPQPCRSRSNATARSARSSAGCVASRQRLPARWIGRRGASHQDERSAPRLAHGRAARSTRLGDGRGPKATHAEGERRRGEDSGRAGPRLALRQRSVSRRPRSRRRRHERQVQQAAGHVAVVHVTQLVRDDEVRRARERRARVVEGRRAWSPRGR